MRKSGFGLAGILMAIAVFLSSAGIVSGQGWGGTEMISSGTRNADSPRVAVGPDGRAVAAFTELSEIVPGIMYTMLTYSNIFDGSSWATAERIDVPNGWESDDPQVAMDSSGNAFAAFVEYTSASHVYCNYWDGSAWSGAAPADQYLDRQTDWPEVAMDGSGNAIVLFRTYDTYNKLFAGYWNGSAWTALQIISELGAETDADSPGIAMDETGDAIAVWRQYGSPNRIYARHRNGSSWGTLTTIDMGWGENALAPQVAMDGNGNALAVFYNYDDAHDQHACAAWWNGSAWSGATTIDNGPGYSATALRAALNGNGEAVAVFVSTDGAKNRVWATLWDGSSWSTPEIIDSGAWTDAETTAVAIDGSGRALSAFTEFSETGSSTGPRKAYAAVYDGSAWSAPVRIDREVDADSSAHPEVAMDASGHAMVVFDQKDGSDKHVYAKRYVFPAQPSSTWNYDYNGDGISEIAIFRESTGLWAVRGLTRVYFGGTNDLPIPGDYDGDGTTDVAIFRDSSGLWAALGVTRAYFGGSSDTPLPRDYDGDGTSDIAIRRPATGLWAVRGVTRVYFGNATDEPIPGDYNGYGITEIGIFRESTGLWASSSGDRIYFGRSGDQPVPAVYNLYPGLNPAIFRGSSGLWAVQNITRHYFGTSTDTPVPADYDGDGIARIGIFRESSGLWAIQGLTRVYFGAVSDIPVTR